MNRFLIDKNTHDYFVKHFNGIESLLILTQDDIKRIIGVSGEINSWFIYKKTEETQGLSFINERIRNIHVQKIEDLFEKETPLPIYNIEIQIVVGITDDEDKNKKTAYVVSIGNTNAISGQHKSN